MWVNASFVCFRDVLTGWDGRMDGWMAEPLSPDRQTDRQTDRGEMRVVFSMEPAIDESRTHAKGERGREGGDSTNTCDIQQMAVRVHPSLT